VVVLPGGERFTCVDGGAATKVGTDGVLEAVPPVPFGTVVQAAHLQRGWSYFLRPYAWTRARSPLAITLTTAFWITIA
jgi:hypothetical protein